MEDSRLTLVEDLGKVYPTEKSKKKERYGMYKCTCGSTKRIRSSDVNSTKVKSCGCLGTEKRTTHGLRGTKLYGVWQDQKYRCTVKSNHKYKEYGGRGITFAEEFLDVTVWHKYIMSLENAEKATYSIDRIDNDRGYEVGNLRWASKSVQTQNTRRISKANTSGYRGVSKDKNTHRYTSRVIVNKVGCSLGAYATAREAGLMYDYYVLSNELEHTSNGLLDTYVGPVTPCITPADLRKNSKRLLEALL